MRQTTRKQCVIMLLTAFCLHACATTYQGSGASTQLTPTPTSQPIQFAPAKPGLTPDTSRKVLLELQQCRIDRKALAAKNRQLQSKATLDRQHAIKQLQIQLEACEKKRMVEKPALWLKVGLGVAVTVATAAITGVVVLLVDNQAKADHIKRLGGDP